MHGVRRRRLVTLGVAAAGVLAGHWLTYLVDVPDAHARAAVLAATGHAYLSIAGELVTVFATVSIVAVFLGALLDAGAGPRPGRALAVRLSVLQIGAFVAMEVLERVVSGASITTLLRGDILPTGVVANVAVALIGALALRWILRAADRVAERVASGRPAASFPRRALRALAPVSFVRPSLVALACVPPRGPPSPFVP